MNDKRQNSTKKGGLGRSLGELLSDNEELSNVENKVLMHKSDGSTVMIYNKSVPKGVPSPSENREKRAGDRSVDRESSAQNRTHPTLIKRDEESLYGGRIMIGKTRQERNDEANGLYRMGKPHVIVDGEAERIRISTRPKPEPEQPRIVLDSTKNADGEDAEALRKLKKYSPRAADEFLEALRELTDEETSKEYQTDKDGRIVIGATLSRVKKR